MSEAHDYQNQLWSTMMESMEKGILNMGTYQQELGKISLEIYKKQHDLFAVLQSNLSGLEAELKAQFEDLMDSTKLNIEEIGLKDLSTSYENWGNRLNDAMSLYEQLSDRPSFGLLEESQTKMYEVTQNILEEQKVMQKETVENMEKYLSKLLEIQGELLQVLQG